MGAFIQLVQLFMNLAAVVGIVFMIMLHAILAQAVANDVDRLRERGRKPYFFGSVGWAFATFVLGLVTIAFYWAIHYSTLRDAALDRSLSER